MSSAHGQFVWCELMTTDLAAATAFYRRVVGWEAKDSGMPGIQYTILSAGETGVGGIVEMPQAARDGGWRPGWIGYIGADDVDAAAARVQAAGGRIHRAAEDIPGVGRFSVVADPQGAPFTLFKPMEGGPPASAAGSAPGRVGWHELHTTDWQAAFTFYADLFGWTKDTAMDMGPMGTYQIFAVSGVQAGGMMNNGAVPAPFWLHYFNVDGIDAAVSRVKDAGGQLAQGPHEVPGGSWIAQCSDPQGVTFAMVAPRR